MVFNKDILYLTQQKYVKELLDIYGLFDIKECDTLMTNVKGISKANGIALSPTKAST